MQRSDLVGIIASKHRVSRDDAAAVIETILEAMGKELVAGGTVSLRRFGRFTVKDRKCSPRDFVTGEVEPMVRRVISFTPSPGLKERVNGSQ